MLCVICVSKHYSELHGSLLRLGSHAIVLVMLFYNDFNTKLPFLQVGLVAGSVADLPLIGTVLKRKLVFPQPQCTICTIIMPQMGLKETMEHLHTPLEVINHGWVGLLNLALLGHTVTKKAHPLH